MVEYKGMPALRLPKRSNTMRFLLWHADVGYRTGLAERRGSPRCDLKEEKATDLALTALAKSVMTVEAEADP